MSECQVINEVEAADFNDEAKTPNCKRDFSKDEFGIGLFSYIDLCQSNSFFLTIGEFCITDDQFAMSTLILIFNIILRLLNRVKLLHSRNFLDILNLIFLLHLQLSCHNLSMMIIISIMVNTWNIWSRLFNGVILILLEVRRINIFLLLLILNQPILLQFPSLPVLSTLLPLFLSCCCSGACSSTCCSHSHFFKKLVNYYILRN
jgi:hypothetical protein